MRSNFDELNPRRHIVVENTIVNNPEFGSDTPPLAEDFEEEAYLELLSAYIDGEVDASERKQVQEWLDNDPKIHQQYMRMLRVQEAFRQTPVPPVSSVSSFELSEQVFQRLDRERKGRFLSFGVVIVGAISIGMLTSVLVKGNSDIPKLAQEEGLMIALNYPVIDIPSATISSKNISQSRK
ncbi:putative transmembrane anti-sigma factor [Gloeothece citriformis PCC 7424]|uniref:Putative transmembrane anti-sigma factor n=1 Tax=Gloeothece citriformis (strain PCC 7424) TaxID=65393 RepID=B7KH10_GLOC7|nr:RseA family anti-sigma factor [Gloeothece citriformis]ACK73497.1 putative transmembrane anti-sigma factor [Gloeothece citriformis PCC 7424]